MLLDLRAVLSSFIKDRHIRVYWVTMPPFYHQSNASVSDDPHLTMYKNELAKNLLQSVGVRIIDANIAILRRLTEDPSSYLQRSRYCSPHPSAIPALINRIIYHDLTLNGMSLFV